MSDRYTRVTKQIGERIVDATQKLQERQISATKRLRERINEIAPRLADVELPLIDVLPSPLAIARANFALAETLLDAQKSYTIGVLDSVAPSRKKTPKAKSES